MAMKLIEWKFDDEVELIMLDTIETWAEWQTLTPSEREQLEELFVNIGNVVEYDKLLIGRDVSDGYMTFIPKSDIVQAVAV
jgi:hypothetical protein